jgi:flagellar hook protein FlgE
MAASPSHRFGQVVGTILEETLQPELQRFCDARGLYLDRHGARVGVRKDRKVSWYDKYGNKHDLDFVIEKGGSDTVQGRPVAFIEAAWRSYTKHSKNKAQEIQGAVLPISEKYERDAPFLGAVLAGEFTKPSLDQLKSAKFEVVYLPYETVIQAFESVEINARFDEKSNDSAFAECIEQIGLLTAPKREELQYNLRASNRQAFDNFFASLGKLLDRAIERITVLPLFGASVSFSTTTAASAFIEEFDMSHQGGVFQKYEVTVIYTNKDEIRGVFDSKDGAKEFLRHVSS